MASSKEIKLRSKIKKIILNFFDLFGYELKRKNNFLDRWGNFITEANEQEKKDLIFFQKICLASELNLWSINQSLKYIYHQKIEGDIVECGVYNGNTLSYIGKISEDLKLNKKIWGYDTFSGFVDETYTSKDTDFKTGKEVNIDNVDVSFNLKEVKKNIIKNDSKNFDKYIFIEGDVIKTLDKEENLPQKISFLRLDTDLYKTTKKQLDILYSRLSKGGILHIDDYGLCPGVRSAIDEFFFDKHIWLHRVDISCRYLIKK
tara:strand:+ start:498 stop:1277 length:780 start_codon:yes stop_codon:yes gene_type:complete